MRPLLLACLLLFSACQPQTAERGDRPLRIVATTSIVGDLARQLAGGAAEVESLMGPGVDPHLYQASQGDVRTLGEADLILYNGLDLEGRLEEVFEQMNELGRATVAVADVLPSDSLVSSANYASQADPHVWMSVPLWRLAASRTAEALIDADPDNAPTYSANRDAYLARLDALDTELRNMLAAVPPERRVLVTAHDAFAYFGRTYGFRVEGLQGISTATEAGTADVQRLAAFIAERELPAIFVESSVSPRSIEAVQEAVRARGHDVQIGASLFSDALGDGGTPEGTYEGMMRHNFAAIAGALGGPAL
jgi:manganese/zinc/iron transport system substrate-binding protein